MDFRLGEAQQAATKAAAAVLALRPPCAPDSTDAEAWRLLAGADLLGLGLSEEYGGTGHGLLEVCAVLIEQGRYLAAVPIVETVLAGGPAIERYGTDEQCRALLPGISAGERVVVPALAGVPVDALDDGGVVRLRGAVSGVPYGAGAHQLLVPTVCGDGPVQVFLVDVAAPGVGVEEQTTTSGLPQALITLDGAPSQRLGGADCHRFLLERATVGVCALQVGVLEEALRLTAGYTSQREQFGRPIATFQAVATRAADAYADVKTARVTMWRAAWLLSAGLPAASAVAVAKFWAAEAGYRVSATAQHLHGGVGVSTDYPLHRYTRWARQNELTFGGSGAQLAVLGHQLAGEGIDS